MIGIIGILCMHKKDWNKSEWLELLGIVKINILNMNIWNNWCNRNNRINSNR